MWWNEDVLNDMIIGERSKSLADISGVVEKKLECAILEMLLSLKLKGMCKLEKGEVKMWKHSMST